MRWLRGLANWLGSGKDAPVEPVPPEAGDEVSWARPAGWADVLAVADLLQAEGVEYVLVGGYALNYNGIIRQTTDVDILVRDTPENNARWIRALSRLPDRAAEAIDPSAGNPFVQYAYDEDGEDDDNGVIRLADEFIIDVMQRACGKSYDDLTSHVMVSSKGNRSLRVLDLEGLRMLKQGVRDKDRQDLRMIEAAIAALGADMPVHQDAMGNRRLVGERPASTDAAAFRVLPPPDEDRVARAGAVLERLAATGYELAWDAETLAAYCDGAEIEGIGTAGDPAARIEELMAEKGLLRP